QNVLAFVTEVLSQRQAGQSNTCTGTRRLVHLAVDKCCLGAFAAALLVHTRVDELVVKVVTFTRALTNASENGIAAVRLRDVVDQFLNKNRLANARATEQADLTALGIGRQEVENLDASDQDFRFRRLLDIFRSGLVNTAGLRCVDRSSFINRLTNHVDDAAEHFGTDRNADGRTRISNRLTTHQTIGRVHRDTTYRVLTEVLSNLKNQAISLVVGLKRIQDRRQIVLELDVHHRANNLTDGSNRAI